MCNSYYGPQPALASDGHKHNLLKRCAEKESSRDGVWLFSIVVPRKKDFYVKSSGITFAEKQECYTIVIVPVMEPSCLKLLYHRKKIDFSLMK